MKTTSIFLLLFYCLLHISCKSDNSSFINVPEKKSISYQNILSSDDITAFVMDKSEKIWIGTSYGLNLYDGYRYHQFFHNDTDPLSISDNNITCLFKDSHDTIWIGTDNGLTKYIGYDRFETIKHISKDTYSVTKVNETSDHRIIVCTKNEICELVNGILIPKLRFQEEHFSLETDKNKGFWIFFPRRSIYYNNQYIITKNLSINFEANMVQSTQDNNRIWAMQGRTISCIDANTQEYLYKPSKEIQILANIIYPTQDGLLLKSNKHGIYKFDLKLNKLTSWESKSMLQQTDDLISCLYKDSKDNWWIGFHNGGFQHINKENIALNTINQTILYRTTADQYITTISGSENGVVWGGTNTIIFRYDSKSNHLTQYSQENVLISGPYFKQLLKKIIPTTDNKIWILTNARISLATYQKGKISIEHSFRPWCLLGDCTISNNKCYTTANKKYLYAISQQGQVDSIPINHPMYNNKSQLLKLKNGNILLAMQGLNFILLDTKRQTIKHLKTNNLLHKSNVSPLCLLEDEKGDIWIGSNGYGLYNLDLKNMHIKAISSLPAQQIMSILNDKEGNLWMGTRKGIMSYSPHNHLSQLYEVKGISKRSFKTFNQQCICSLNNQIILGSKNGCLAIMPSIMQRQTNPNLEIRRIYVRNDASKRLAVSKNNRHYIFSHKENDLEINFGGINFGESPYYIYEYQLQGFEKNWIPAGSVHEVFYSNLPPGDYHFKVRIMQSYGANALAEKSVAITIQQTPWLSFPAIITYFMLFISLIIYINYLYWRIRSNRIALVLANTDKEREKRTNQMNMSFFANISHEFRNPLTMIAGPINSLYNDSSLPHTVHHKLEIVKKSTNSMLKLIEQMLDFNQLENDVLRLRVSQYDIIHEINLWADIFEESTKEQNITLQRNGLEGSFYTWFDHDKLDKILGNLFTNALKHTPEEGIIRITVEKLSFAETTENFKDELQDCEYLCIGIFNNGKHIPKEKLNEVFKRYYQIKELNENHQHGWGTGIGLYYVQRLIQLHHGSIRVDNVPDGGVLFRFILPIGETMYQKDEHITFEHEEIVSTLPIIQPEEYPIIENNFIKRPKILIIDDNTQLACYLRSIFINEFEVENKYSAEAALQDIEHIAPDIILSDVIMEEMSGYDLCRILKEDVAFSHIPFILITAKSKMNEQITGLELGANAYVTKPFNPDYLLALVRSQLKNCENLRKLLNENTQIKQLEGKLSNQDKIFMDELYQLMEKHLADLDLNLNSICEELRISRSKFNYKIKGLTGDTPNNFFKSYKLNRAAKLLREGKYNISEIAIMTGFNTLSYFSICFKKQFGVNPSEYK